MNLDFNIKQGGKLNYMDLFEKGGKSPIHIKKKNRSKFTDYCGGHVTEECIRRGKNSSNPVIRKRATFAANVRRWKHEDGGIIKAYTGLSTTTFGNYVKSEDYLKDINLDLSSR